MTRKHERQAAILELVASHVVGSQEELRQLLLERGMDVTQATLSRDLRTDDDKPLLTNLLPQLFSRVDGVGELIVLHTVASGAQPIAEAIDQEEFAEVLGTIAGDDTILIVTRSVTARLALTEHLRELAGDR